MEKYIVAVTACPTGIAHTYMAAEKLAVVGKEMGYEVKVETQGTSGAQNILTEEDIARADGIILAVDKEIDESRFAGKHVLKTSVGSAIRESKKLIENAVSKTNTVVVSAKKGDEQKTLSAQGAKSIYKHIMAGVSYMLPIVVAGGILTALSFAFGIYAFQNEGSLAWAFYQIGAAGALGLMVPVLSAYIAHSIADKAGFAAGLVGGWLANSVGAGFLGGMLAGFIAGYVTLFLNKAIRLPVTFRGIKDILIVPILSVAIVGLLMLYVIGTPIHALNTGISNLLQALSGGSIIIMGIVFGILYWDLGGPFSKVLYAFAVGMIAEGIYEPMAAVIVCGMIPPLGMAVATFIKPNLWTQEQKEAGKASLFLGLSYITEGAIPFAAEKPLVVLPSCVVGGAVGAILSLSMHTGIVAPHGGIFLLLIPNAVHNPAGFLIALAIGTVVTALMATVLKTLETNRKR